MIEVNGLRKEYRTADGQVVALRDIDLIVARGEIFGIVGRSGAGKSTLLRCLNLLERPTAGEVVLDGRPLSGLSKHALRQARREIGVVFQHFNLLSSRTARENVELPLEIVGIPAKQRRERALELLELVGLVDRSGSYPSQLSGGQKQRVGIARALAADPKVLLCDEPTSALDSETTEQILDLVIDINEKLGLTVVVITHELDVVRRACDSAALLDDGAVVDSGRLADIVGGSSPLGLLLENKPVVPRYLQRREGVSA